MPRVQVRLLTPTPKHPSADAAVELDLEDDSPMWEVKLKLQELTGVPVAHQKVFLQGIGHIVMADKRGSLGFTHSAVTGSFYLGLLGAGTVPAHGPRSAAAS